MSFSPLLKTHVYSLNAGSFILTILARGLTLRNQNTELTSEKQASLSWSTVTPNQKYGAGMSGGRAHAEISLVTNPAFFLR